MVVSRSSLMVLLTSAWAGCVVDKNISCSDKSECLSTECNDVDYESSLIECSGNRCYHECKCRNPEPLPPTPLTPLVEEEEPVQPHRDALFPDTGCSGGLHCQCMPRSELIKRAKTWIGVVPYSNTSQYCPGGCNYNTMCSGFLSWAANITHLDGRWHDLSSHSFSSYFWSTPVTKDELQQGDIVTHVKSDELHESGTGCKGHSYFFDQWVDKRREEFWAYEATHEFQVTECCKNKTCPCYAHYLKKSWTDEPAKWMAEDKCTNGTDHRTGTTLCSPHDPCYGGPRRLHPWIVCPPDHVADASASVSVV